MLCLHLPQSALMHLNTIFLPRVLATATSLWPPRTAER